MGQLNNIFALEGPDFCGKSTALPAVKALLEQAGLRVAAMVDPGSTALGVRLRPILLDKTLDDISPRELLILFVASSSALMRAARRRLMADTDVVLLDRCYLSNLAYRHADGIPFEESLDFAERMDLIIPPPRLFYLDVPASVRRRRALHLADRGQDRFESRSDEWKDAIDAGYERCSTDGLCTRIDGDRPVPGVAKEIAQLILKEVRGTPCTTPPP